MNEELKQHNLELFCKKLEQVGANPSVLIEKYGEKLKNATFSVTDGNGLTGDGTLINTVLKILTPFAVRLNLLYPEDIRVNQNTLVKVCLLHQISKALRLIPNDNQWEVEKRNIAYKYDAKQPSIRTGLHSLIMAEECGINISAEEAEAITINDRDLTDNQSRWHSSLMASIVRQANEMTYLTAMNIKYKK